MGIRSKWHTKGSRKTKVRNLELPFRVDEKILRLQISVHDAFRMQEQQAQEQLAEQFLSFRTAQIMPAE